MQPKLVVSSPFLSVDTVSKIIMQKVGAKISTEEVLEPMMKNVYAFQDIKVMRSNPMPSISCIKSSNLSPRYFG